MNVDGLRLYRCLATTDRLRLSTLACVSQVVGHPGDSDPDNPGFNESALRSDDDATELKTLPRLSFGPIHVGC